MPRAIALLLAAVLPLSATAQDAIPEVALETGQEAGQETGRTAIFEDHAALRAFIDTHMAEGNLTEIYTRLSPDPVAAGEVARAQTVFDGRYDAPFEMSGYLFSTATPEGFREDVLVYWNADDDYVYMLLVTHQRADNLIVLRWQIETSHATVMQNL